MKAGLSAMPNSWERQISQDDIEADGVENRAREGNS